MKLNKRDGSLALLWDDTGLWPVLPQARSLLWACQVELCLLFFHLLYSAGDQTLGLQPCPHALFAFKEADDHVCELMCDLFVSSAMSFVNTDTPVLAHMPSLQPRAVRAAVVRRPEGVRADKSVVFEGVGSYVSTVDGLEAH